MNRAEFMRRLTELLGDVPPQEREEAIQYYNDYFDDAGAENESGVIASLGTPEELAGAIKAGLSDGGNGGEFTESGFSGYTQIHKDEIARTGEQRVGGQPGSAGGFSGTSGQTDGRGRFYGSGASGNTANGRAQTNNAYYEDAYYQKTGGKGIYGGREDTRKQFNPYEQPGGDSSHTSGGQQTPPKQGMSGGMIVLLVIAAVLTSPIWIGILGGLFGVAVGAVGTVFGLFLALLIIGVVFVVVAVALIILGIVVMFSAPLAGISMIGTALVLFAVGLVCIWLMVLTVAMAIPALVRGIAALGRKLFHRGGAQA